MFYKISNFVVITVIACIFTGCYSTKYQNVNDVEEAVLKEQKSKDFAQISKKMKNLKALEISKTNIPYKVFYFYNNKVGYSIIAYENELIILSYGSGKRAGYTDSFAVIKKYNKTTLYYTVKGSSTKWLFGKYVLGNKTAEFPYSFNQLPISLRTCWENE